MPRRPKLERSATPYPDVPVSRATGARALTPEEWLQVANDVKSAIVTALNARQTMEDNWAAQNAIYELYSDQINEPFENASNVFLPVAVAKLDALWAQVAAKVFVPDIHLVTANPTDDGSPGGAPFVYRVQRWYNTEFRRERIDQSTRLRESLDLLHYGLLNGTSVLEVMWRHTEEDELFLAEAPTLDIEGNPSFDESGQFQTATEEVLQTIVTSEARWTCRQIKDVVIVPGESKRAYSAVGIGVIEWLYESDLQALLAEKALNFDAEMVEKALQNFTAGTSEVASDRQGVWDKDAGGQLSIGQGQGPMVSAQFKNRGPLKVWRYHTDQFDMNHDGLAERGNVVWWDEITNTMLGWCPARVIAPQKPFFFFSPLPRQNSIYGFSFLERMAPINAEINTVHNDRNNYIQMATKPPMLGNINYESRAKDFAWGLNQIWWVDDVDKSFELFQMPQIPLSSWQEEAQLNAYADQLAGLSSPQTGGQTSGRKSATEIKASLAGSGVRSDLIALFLRLTLRSAFQYTHQLNLQNLPDNPPEGSDFPPKTMLKQNYNLDIAGTGDPIDMQTYGQEVLAFYQLMAQDKDIQSDAEKRYFLKREVAQILHISNIEAILGTADEATEKKKGEAQQAQVAGQLQIEEAKAKIIHDAHGQKVTPEPPGSKTQPSGNGQAPQPAAPVG